MTGTTAEPSETKIQIGMDPACKAGSLIAGIKPFSTQRAHQIIDEIKRQIEAVRLGNLSRGEAMLVAQAEALDVLFYSYLSKADTSENEEAMGRWLRLAVIASKACCEALAGLSAIRVESSEA